jgi:hypothetical protein
MCSVAASRNTSSKDGNDARVDVRNVFAQVGDRMRHQWPTGKSAHRDQAGAAVGEFKYLQRLGKLDQLEQVVGDALLGPDDVGDAKALLTGEFGVLLQLDVAHARDAGRHVEEIGGDLASHQVGLVGRRDRDQQVGVVGAGLALHRR